MPPLPSAPTLRDRLYAFLRWTERYTKTDMVYLATSGFWINLNFAFVSVFSFLLSIAFANFLSQTQYGVYQYLLSIAGILAAFTFTGFNTSITQSVARGYEGTLRASIRPQLLWNLVPALAAFLWSGYYILLGQTMLGAGIAFIGISLPIINTYNSYGGYLSGKQDFRRLALYLIAGNAAYYICIFAGILVFPQALLLIFINLFVTTLTTFILYKRVADRIDPRAGADPGALGYAKHLSTVNGVATIAGQIDNILVFHFLGAADLALYSIASLLPERLGGFFKSLTSAAIPRLAGRDLGEVRTSIGRRLFVVLLSTLVIAGLYMLAAPFLFRLIYPKYIGAIGYSQFYALTLVSYVGSLVTSVFYAHRKTRELYILNTVVPVAQIIVQVSGIILWGLWGLVGAKVVSSLISSTANLIALRQGRGA
jgi:O-antigen/teichoic acid export membrane protein